LLIHWKQNRHVIEKMCYTRNFNLKMLVGGLFLPRHCTAILKQPKVRTRKAHNMRWIQLDCWMRREGKCTPKTPVLIYCFNAYTSRNTQLELGRRNTIGDDIEQGQDTPQLHHVRDYHIDRWLSTIKFSESNFPFSTYAQILSILSRKSNFGSKKPEHKSLNRTSLESWETTK
jgi:hypothetical protein